MSGSLVLSLEYKQTTENHGRCWLLGPAAAGEPGRAPPRAVHGGGHLSRHEKPSRSTQEHGHTRPNGYSPLCLLCSSVSLSILVLFLVCDPVSQRTSTFALVGPSGARLSTRSPRNTRPEVCGCDHFSCVSLACDRVCRRGCHVLRQPVHRKGPVEGVCARVRNTPRWPVHAAPRKLLISNHLFDRLWVFDFDF